MKNFALNYYPEFKCIAQNCAHTCCAGWEICIDSQSLSNYKNEKSEFGDCLRNGINFKKGKFKTDKSGRCAFLNGSGLCDIITNLGEQSLCQVCSDHPRFRSFWDDRVETGLGFCCEQATKIILSYKETIHPLLLDDDQTQNKLSFVKERVLAFREKALFCIQDRKTDINKRIYNLLELCGVKDFLNLQKGLFKAFFSFERLDKSWTVRLKNANKNDLALTTNDCATLWCEQFLANSIYRHLSDAEDIVSAKIRTVACVFSWWVINSIYLQEVGTNNHFDTICDIVRAFSAEVEYSQKNLTKLFNFAYKFINK